MSLPTRPTLPPIKRIISPPNKRCFPTKSSNPTSPVPKPIVFLHKVKLHTIQCDALIDTGASISAVNKFFISKFVDSPFNRVKINPFSVSLSVDSETKITVNEKIEIPIQINDANFLWYFYIVPNLNNEVVVGMDFLMHHNVNIQCGPNRLQVNNSGSISVEINSPDANSYADKSLDSIFPSPIISSTAPSADENSYSLDQTSLCSSPNALKLSNPVYLAPRTLTRVVFCSADKINGDIIVSPNKILEHSRLIAIGRCVVKLKDGTGCTFVGNLTNKPIRLNRNVKIGEFEILENDFFVTSLDEISSQSIPNKIQSMQSLSLLNENKDWLHEIKIGSSLSLDEKRQLWNLITQYPSVFSKHSKDLGRSNLFKHRIITNENVPIKQRPYRVGFKERREITRITHDLLDKKLISHSNSPWSSPVVLVMKKDGTYRFCVDYRRLNEISKKDSYPLPRIDDALDRLSGAKYFSTMDCDSAYYQVEVDERDREKTAFITPDGLFEFNVMPFGLTNAPATFQRLIDTVLSHYKWSIALVYLDDIFVFSATFSQHLENLELIFKALQQANLKLKPSKCKFADHELLFLGHIITPNGVKVNPAKLKAVTNFPTPTKLKDVQAFVSLCSYYRRFVPNFAQIAKPLTQLTQKDVPFKWTDDCKNAFETLKNALLSDKCLAYPDDYSPTEIHTDASYEGLGTTLVQVQNGVERVVAFASRSLAPYEKNYSASELECMGVIYGIEKFHPYIYGRKFKVVTDHCSLCFLMNTKDPRGRLARWALRLQPYDFEIVYKSGRKHLAVDALSRYPVDPPPSSNHDPLNFEQHLCKLDTTIIQLCSLNEANIVQLQKNDPKIYPIYEALLKIPPLPPNDKKSKKLLDYRIVDEVLYKFNPEEFGQMWRLVVPKKLQRDIMTEVHVVAGSHLGFSRCWFLLKSKYYWPTMYSSFFRFIRSCDVCQFNNFRCTKTPGPMQLFDIPSKPFDRIAIDFIGPFPTTAHNNKYILVMIDHLTRFVEAKPCKSADSANTISILKDSIIFKHSCPSQLLTDNATSFTSREFTHFCKEYGIKITYTSPYNPGCNGMCERVNSTIKRSLAKFINPSHDDWDEHLTRIIFSINITPHRVTKYTPFYLLYGREPNLKCDVKLKLEESYVDDDQSQIYPKRTHHAQRIAKNRISMEQLYNKNRFDQSHPIKVYAPDDLVLIANYVRKKGKVSKFLYKWSGPFVIVNQIGPINYLVKDCRENTKKVGKLRKVSVRHLKPYYKRDYKTTTESSENESSSDVDSDFSLIPYPNTNKQISVPLPSEYMVTTDTDDEFQDAMNDHDDPVPNSPESIEIELPVVNEIQAQIPIEAQNDGITLRRSTRSRVPPQRYNSDDYIL